MMHWTAEPAEIVALLAIVVAGVLLVLWQRAETRGARRSRSRQVRARRGEDRAESLLASYGMVVVARQPSVTWTIEVDGSPVPVRSRADWIVEARRCTFAEPGTRFVAEVKTGTRAPDPAHPATRRQLLEYQLVFDVDGVLLVDMEAETLHAVEFPIL